MIKFFRRIRYDLMEKNKTGKPALPAGKYFKYAIGEIILVVIGILIALSINNWNENRKLKVTEKAVITSLIEDLKIDNNHFEEEKIHLEQQLKLVDELITDPTNSKLAQTDLHYLRYGVNLYPVSFEDNIPKDIYNKDVIESIKTYYRDQQTTITSVNIYVNVVLDLVRPFLRKYGIHNPKMAIEINFDSLNNELLIEEKLAKHYGSDELGQILFELRLKAAEFLDELDNLSEANTALITDLKAYTND